jgi:hypothetical protein
VNTTILAIGTALASIMGTTGAAMLLIRPLLKANDNRKHRVHVVVFFIFLVANVGGGLTPLGDPPLFLGFLKGVTFGWTFQHMLLPVLACLALLLVFFLLDSHFYRREDEEFRPHHDQPLRCMASATLSCWPVWWGRCCCPVSGSRAFIWKWPGHAELQNLVRDGLLLLLALLSLWITPSRCGPAMSSTGIRFWKWASCLPASSSPSARPLPSCVPVRMVSWPPWCMRYPGRMASR